MNFKLHNKYWNKVNLRNKNKTTLQPIKYFTKYNYEFHYKLFDNVFTANL